MGQLAVPAILAAGTVGAGAVGGALQNDPFQRRETFRDTGADPVGWMTDVRKLLGSTMGGAIDRANQPIDLGPGPQAAPAISTRYPPSQVGGAGFASSPARVPMAGFNLPAFNATATGHHRNGQEPIGHAVPRGSVPMGQSDLTGSGEPSPMTPGPTGGRTQAVGAAELLKHALLARPA